MEQNLVNYAVQLFQGAPGSLAQKQANEWLMQYQTQAEAWEASLSIISQYTKSLPVNTNEANQNSIAQLVASQILRAKATQEWKNITIDQQKYVVHTILNVLKHSCSIASNPLSKPIVHALCATLGTAIVQSTGSWANWKNDIQELVIASKNTSLSIGLIMVLNILSAIPKELRTYITNIEVHQQAQIIQHFQQDYSVVMQAVCMALHDVQEALIEALECLESWQNGCLSLQDDTFGFTIIHFFQFGLIDPLCQVIIGKDSILVAAATDILIDSFTCIPSSELPTEAVIHLVHWLLQLNSPAFITQSISRIASNLSVHHGSILYSSEFSMAYDQIYPTLPSSLVACNYLKYLLELTRCNLHDVMQPTLEAWFFLLTQLERLSPLGTPDSLPLDNLSLILSRVIPLLVEKCQFSQDVLHNISLSKATDLKDIFQDESDLENFKNTRREIADTVIALFSKWPVASHDDEHLRYLPCVKSLVDMLKVACSRSSIATIEAVLYLLDFSIELFDIASDESTDGDFEQVERSIASVGGEDCPIKEMYQVAIEPFTNFPRHPLTSISYARFLQSLNSHSGSMSLDIALPIVMNLVSNHLLVAPLSFPHVMKTVREYVPLVIKANNDIDPQKASMVRNTLRTELVKQCNNAQSSLCSTVENVGALYETTFSVMGGDVENSDYQSICGSLLNQIMTTLSKCNSEGISKSSQNVQDVSIAIRLCGHAVSGMNQSLTVKITLSSMVATNHRNRILNVINQLWIAIAHAIMMYEYREVKCSAVFLFIQLVPIANADNIIKFVVDCLMSWYTETEPPPDIILCLSNIVEILTKSDTPSSNAFAFTISDGILKVLYAKYLGSIAVHQWISPEMKKTLESTFVNADELKRSAILQELNQFWVMLQRVARLNPQIAFHNKDNEAKGSRKETIYCRAMVLSCLLLDCDIGDQLLCDNICAYWVDIFISSKILQGNSSNWDDLKYWILPIFRILIHLLGPKGITYTRRSFSECLFRLLHSPKLCVFVKDLTHNALRSLSNDECFLSYMSVQESQEVITELLQRRELHRFRVYCTNLSIRMRRELSGIGQSVSNVT